MPPSGHEGSEALIEQEFYAGERPFSQVVGNGMEQWLTGWVTMPYEWHDATRWIDEYRYAIAGGTSRITFCDRELRARAWHRGARGGGTQRAIARPRAKKQAKGASMRKRHTAQARADASRRRTRSAERT